MKIHARGNLPKAPGMAQPMAQEVMGQGPIYLLLLPNPGPQETPGFASFWLLLQYYFLLARPFCQISHFLDFGQFLHFLEISHFLGFCQISRFLEFLQDFRISNISPRFRDIPRFLILPHYSAFASTLFRKSYNPATESGIPNNASRFQDSTTGSWK